MHTVLYRTTVLLYAAAAATGLLFLLKLYYLPDIPFAAENIRHAHSHLMFFGWGVIPPLLILLKKPAGYPGRQPQTQTKAVFILILLFAVFSHPSFLLFGYKSALLGNKKIPLSIIISTVSMILWYFPAYRFFRLARLPFAFLALSTAGAWGLAVLQAAGTDAPVIRDLLKHLFLSWFMFGWLIPVLLDVSIPASGQPKKFRNIYQLIRKRILWISILFLPVTSMDLSSQDGAIGQILFFTGRTSAIIYGSYLVSASALLLTGAERNKHSVSAVALAAAGLSLFFADPDLMAGYRLFFIHTLLAGGATVLIAAGLSKSRIFVIIFSFSAVSVAVSRLLLSPVFLNSWSVPAAVIAAFIAALSAVMLFLADLLDW